MSTITTIASDPAALRAHRLRRQADLVHPIVARAYRRRASELEFENWLRDTAFVREVVAA